MPNFFYENKITYLSMVHFNLFDKYLRLKNLIESLFVSLPLMFTSENHILFWHLLLWHASNMSEGVVKIKSNF